MLRALQPAARALAHVFVLAAVLWAGGFVVTTPAWSMQLYRTWRFPMTQGHHLAATLGDAQVMAGDVCLLVGPSSVREAFDETVMNETAPSLRFLNGGTTGGTIFIYEAMAELVEQSRVRPHCIVVGLNARMLIDRDVRLNAAGYTDFMDWRHRDLLDHEQPALRGEAARELHANTVWPWHRFARQLGRLGRSAIYVLQTRLSWHEPRPLEDFAMGHRELGKARLHNYDDTAPITGAAFAQLLEQYRAEGLYDEARYAGPEAVAALRSVLDDLGAVTPNLIVIRMPESSDGRRAFAPFAADAFEAVLADYEARGVCVIDCRSALADHQLRDLSHVLNEHRPAFSRLAAGRIMECLSQESLQKEPD